MALSSDLIGTSGDCCVCGRRGSKRHCPYCGSFRFYGIINKKTRLPESYRCVNCKQLYVDGEECRADKVEKSMKVVERERASVETEDRASRLQAYMASLPKDWRSFPEEQRHEILTKIFQLSGHITSMRFGVKNLPSIEDELGEKQG